jgi:hypothetical protein
MIVVNKQDFLDTYKTKIFGIRALTKIRNWLPLEESSFLAKIVAYLITDGHLQIKLSKRGSKKYSYAGVFSKNKEELNEFLKDVNSIFKIKGKIRSWGKRKFGFSIGCIITNSSFCRIMNLCGVPEGNKTDKTFDIPFWVKNSNNNEIIKAFLRKCFDCDGTIRCDKKSNRWKISFYMTKTEDNLRGAYIFLSSMKKLLNNLDIETTNIVLKKDIENIRKDGKITKSFWFDIKSKSLIKFCNIIGTYNKNKLKRIKRIIKGRDNPMGHLH